MLGVDATTRWSSAGGRAARKRVSRIVSSSRSATCATVDSEGRADFVWGEDAWCYVVDKAKLVAEAARLVKPSGTIAFTDWMEGPAAMSDEEAATSWR